MADGTCQTAGTERPHLLHRGHSPLRVQRLKRVACRRSAATDGIHRLNGGNRPGAVVRHCWLIARSATKAVIRVGRRGGNSSLFDLVRGNAAVNDAEHLAHERRTAGEQESQRIGKAQHPLAYRLFGKHFVHQQRRALGHAPGADAGDLKSPEALPHAGSTPAPGTRFSVS